MSLPERIRLYVLKSPTGGIVGITHDKILADRDVKLARQEGVELSIEQWISRRLSIHVGVRRERCMHCCANHDLSAEASDGYELIPRACEAAILEAMEARDERIPFSSSGGSSSTVPPVRGQGVSGPSGDSRQTQDGGGA